jgi:Lrp/AsnC family leucine-responsive transcriptional regulator
VGAGLLQKGEFPSRIELTSGNFVDIKRLRKKRLEPKFFNLLDPIDLKILFILQNDGRRRLADIADDVELSAPAVMERVKKLEASGVIRGYQALLDGKKVGKDITAFIGVSIGNQRDMEKFARQMMRYPDVLECHHVTGDESFMLKVKSANTGSLEKLLGEIRSVEGVTQTVTRVVLSTAKEGQALEIDAGLAGINHARKR